MSSIVIQSVDLNEDNYELSWEKDMGFVVRENGDIVNQYGPNESVARKKFSRKIAYLRRRR